MRVLALIVGLMSACGSRPQVGTVQVREPGDPLPISTGAIGGIVRDAQSGEPLPMAMVFATRDGVVVADDVSDVDGRYQISPLPPGHYDVTAKFSGSQVEYKAVHVEKHVESKIQIKIDGRDHRDRVNTAAGEGLLGSIAGIVVDGVDGDGIGGTVVSLQAKHLEDAIFVLADHEGLFQIKGLSPGVYSLGTYYHLVGEGTVEVRRGNIEVKPGEATDVQLVLDLRIR